MTRARPYRLASTWERVGAGARWWALARCGGRLQLVSAWQVLPRGWVAVLPANPVFGLPTSWGDSRMWQHRDLVLAVGLGMTRTSAVEALFSAVENDNPVGGSCPAWARNPKRESMVSMCLSRVACGPVDRDHLREALLEALS